MSIELIEMLASSRSSKQGLDSSEERAGIVSAEEDLSNVDNSAPRVQEMNSEETCVFDNRTHA